MKAETLKQLSENAEAIIPKDGLEKKLITAEKERRPLIVKLGLDPTAPDIHLGHTVVLRKLRQFQDLGHTIILIVGDFTARIGDPSGRSQTRPALPVATIRKNAETYKKQALKVLDEKNLQIRYNSEWLEKLKADDMLRLMGATTVAQVLAREDFAKRLASGQTIGLHELLYPLLQAQDSVAIKADIEIGGTDQTFNMLMGRELQKARGEDQQTVITMPLLIGTDGKQKMSKSLGNYIGVTETPTSIYGKIMSIPDDLILSYTRLLTHHDASFDALNTEAIKRGKMNPMTLKLHLAFLIVEEFCSKKEALKAESHFKTTFQHREFPKDAKELTIQRSFELFELITKKYKLFPSNSEARRKLAEGAVKVNGKKVLDGKTILDPKKGESTELQIGKLGFYRVTRQ